MSNHPNYSYQERLSMKFNGSYFFLFLFLNITILNNQAWTEIPTPSSQTPSQTSSQAPVPFWSFIDQEEAEITCEWIESSDFQNERTVFVNALSETYKNLQLDTNYLNESFDEEVQAFNGKKKIYALSVKKDGNVIGYASFNKTGIQHQVYVRQLVVDPTFWNRGIEEKMLFSIFKKLPETNHLVLAIRKIDKATRKFYTNLGFQECMYLHEELNHKQYIGLEFLVPENMYYDEKTLTLVEVPYSSKKINWQLANK